MRKVLIGLFILLPILLLTSCSSSQSTVVAKYGQDQITYDELKDAYYKSLSEGEKAKADSLEELKEFLDLYVNYKMKLRDAYVRGFDNDPVLQKEIDDYTITVGTPYIQEKFIIDPGMKDLYEKRKIEKRISHILIRTDSIGTDSARALAQSLLDRIKNGESFAKLAYEYTMDDFSKPDSGDVYWLTAGQTVPEFDEAMYATKKGEVYPYPVETRYGFHLLKVTDEEPRVYKVSAKHILASFTQGGGTVDSAAALAKIKEVQQKLEEGADFSELATKYSDDTGSARKGGDLGLFQRRMMVKPFDEVVFKLKVGEVSDIVETRFGYHIIKLTEKLDYPSFEEQKEEIKNLYQRTLYAPDKEKYLEKLKDEFNFTVDDSLESKVKKGNDSFTFGEGYWDDSELMKQYGDSVIISLAGTNYTLNDIAGEFKDNPNYKDAKMTEMNKFKMFLDFKENKLFAAKAKALRNGNTEFSKLMDDYKNGLYIFKLQEEEIWNKLEVDTTQLESIYEETKGDYVWPNRASYMTLFRPDSQSIYKDYSALETDLTFEDLMERNSKYPTLKAKIKEYEKVNIENSDLAKIAYSLKEPGDISNPVNLGNEWYIVKLVEKLPSSQKSFEEAKSEVMAVWQERETKKLEENYIKHLRATYEPEFYYDRLSKENSN